MNYVDDTPNSDYSATEGAAGRRGLTFVGRDGKPEVVVSTEKYRNFALIPSDGRLKLCMEKGEGYERTSPILKAEFKSFGPNNHMAIIETRNTHYTLTGLSMVQKMSLEGAYDQYKHTEMLKGAIESSQGAIDRTIRAIDQTNEGEFSELRFCRNQLQNLNYRLTQYTDYEAQKAEASKLIEQGRENDLKSIEQKIEAGTATTEEVQRYNSFQEGQMKQSMQKAMTEVTEIKVVTTAEIIR